ncbi:MAG: pantoate--beta-alanine ligase [Myxococcales bacterium]|nr:pantoate--beta-alanine ligase [Myxococcales bacterium]
MELLESAAAMQQWATAQRAGGQRIGFVPTMGFLHPGHASLMALLRPQVDRLVVSVYVNPLQFGPGEDLDRYPRDPEGDAALCRDQGVDALFRPPDLYPDGFSTSVSVHGLTEVLCGATRPGHFEGVATVCARLFGLTQCQLAAFGDKDFQQLAVLRRMVRDLALPLEIVGAPLVRDADGVALSSRNKYLSESERGRARSLHRALFGMQQRAAAGERDVAALLAHGRSLLDADRVDYLQIVGAEDLQPLTGLDPAVPARALGAAFYGATRLIDNVAL